MSEKAFAIGFEKKGYKIFSENSKENKAQIIKLVGKENYSKSKALTILHSAAIAHILLPQYTPMPISVTKNTDGGYDLNFEYIPHDALHTKLNKNRIENNGPSGRNSQKVLDEIRSKTDIMYLYKKFSEIGFEIDSPEYNTIMSNGFPIYIDFFTDILDIGVLEKFLQNNRSISKITRELVEAHLGEIRKL